MPVINNTMFIRRLSAPPPIAVLDKYMLVSCEDFIELTVDVVNEQPTDTYWWEQIGGSMVIWMTPRDQKTVVFDQNLVRDDKTFQVTISAGTERETIATVVVSAIPRDTVQWLSHPELYEQWYAERTFSDAESPVGVVMLPGLSPEGTATVLNPNRWLGFVFPPEAYVSNTMARPSVESSIVGYTLHDITDGMRTFVASTGPQVRSFHDLPAGRDYQVLADVRTPGLPKVYPHQALGGVAGYYPPPGYLDVDTWESSTTGVAQFKFAQATHYPRELLTQTLDDDDGFRINLRDALFTATAIHYPRELITQTLDDDDGFRINLQKALFTATTFNLDLGIGTIG